MENIPPPFAVYPLGFHDSKKMGRQAASTCCRISSAIDVVAI